MRHIFMALGLLVMSTPAWGADFTNHIGMKFVTTAAGSFYMGSCKLTEKQKFLDVSLSDVCPSGAGVDKDANDEETPQHEVSLAKPFQMGVYEVTIGQYKKFLATRQDLISEDFIEFNREYGQGNNHPVGYVSWHDARAFASWLNQTKPSSGKGTYRLPSEAEWEYAARAGSKQRYWWGNSINCSQANYSFDDCNSEGSSRVGSYKANPFGLYDVHGNVQEWVEDCPNGYQGSPRDGRAYTRAASECASRVLRGGSWNNNPQNLCAASRKWAPPATRHFSLGFRLSRTHKARAIDFSVNRV